MQKYTDVSVNLIVPHTLPSKTLTDWLEALPKGYEVVVVQTKPSENGAEYTELLSETKDKNGSSVVRLYRWNYLGAFHFGNARNAALENSTRKWVLWLDIDDRVNPRDYELLDCLEEIPDGIGGLWAGTCGFQSATTTDEAEYYAAAHLRIFRRTPTIRWEGRIHENIASSVTRQGYNTQKLPMLIEHLGYNVEQQGMVEKLQRNIELLLLEVQGSLTDPAKRYYVRYLAGNLKQYLELTKE